MGLQKRMKNADPETTLLPGPDSAARPFYFVSNGRQLFAWLHLPHTPRSDLGVLICGPFGYEAICSHRSMRVFAESIASAGIPAMRFDYLGTGDSAEIAEDADYIAAWLHDVKAAVRELRTRAGIERVCLLGVRLGSLLASMAAAEADLADSLMLVGPVVSGRRYVRDLRMAQMAGLAMNAPEEDNDPNSPTSKILEAGGFSLSEATLQSLKALDLQSQPLPAVRSLLILDNDQLPSAKRWAEALSVAGISVNYRALPGIVGMTVTAPQFAAVPVEMLAAMKEWLTGRLGRSGGAIPEQPPASATERVLLPGAWESPQTSICERPVFVISDVPLFGIVTEPPAGEKRRRAVILLNPGADSHIGASRMYVSLARRWARRGYIVLRLDFGGIGDSATRPLHRDDEVFPAQALDDIRSAMDLLRARYGVVDMTLAGLCSGAYHALRAAAAGLPVNRVLMVNPQNYFWKQGMTLEQVQLSEVVHNPGLYRRRVFSPKAWLRIFTGQVNVLRIAAIYLHRARLAAEAVLREWSHRVHLRLPQDLGWDLKDIIARGVSVSFIFARGEPGLDLLKVQAGSTLQHLGEHCRVLVVDSGDHIFSRRGPRIIMENALSEELFARAGDTSRERSPQAVLQRAAAK
jgi:pimeloyl-ACP methyl ester carboxylesterase